MEQNDIYCMSNEEKQRRKEIKKKYINKLIEECTKSLECDKYTPDQIRNEFIYFYEQSLKRPYLKE